MKVDLFDFDLPEERIALRPAEPRDAARLLVVPEEGDFRDRIVRDLPELLQPGDAMVFNDTRVIPAQLEGTRQRGEAVARVEATLHMRTGPDRWKAFLRPAKRVSEGERISFGHSGEACYLGALDATVAEKGEAGEALLVFDLSGPALDEALHAVGPRAAAALYRLAPPRRRARHDRLPDHLRTRGRGGGRADRRPALHARAFCRRSTRAASNATS